MAGKRSDAAAAAEVVDRISKLLLDAVQQTLAERSPEPGRRYLTGLSGGRSDDQRATELMVTLVLVRWLSVAGDEVGTGDLVEPVLAWIREEFGPRFAARARYTSAALIDGESAGQIMGYRDALRGDFLPSLVWQLAAVVALHGEGDLAWLEDLVGKQPSSGDPG
ncbi:MAG: hypothetical protein L0H84_04060 [Pseudonocardia sp.]|nr:hypothetical protein [Pseudonocardia sp.]